MESTFNADNQIVIDGLVYEKYPEKVLGCNILTLVRCPEEREGELILPKTLDHESVVGVFAERCFANSRLTSLTLPMFSFFAPIPAYAFQNSHIKRIVIPNPCRFDPKAWIGADSIEEIVPTDYRHDNGGDSHVPGDLRFENGILYSTLTKKILFHIHSNERTLDLSDMDIEKVESYAFCCCGELREVVLPATVDEIGENAFPEGVEVRYNCTEDHQHRIEKKKQQRLESNIKDVVADGIVTDDERKWLLSELEYMGVSTSELEQVLSDKLQQHIDKANSEMDSLIKEVVRDGKITEEEREQIFAQLRKMGDIDRVAFDARIDRELRRRRWVIAGKVLAFIPLLAFAVLCFLLALCFSWCRLGAWLLNVSKKTWSVIG